MGINYFRRDDRDLRFVLFEYLDMDKLLTYEAYKDFSRDDFSMIVDEALKVCRDVLGPTMQDGDREGCTWKDGAVKAPASFHECWKVMAENGWLAASSSPEFGGQGLPATVGGIVGELIAGANMAFQTFPGLAVGNGRLVENFGTDEETPLSCITVAEAERLLADGQFPPGSMGPKMEAALTFARGRRGTVLITSVEALPDALEGRAGTRIVPDESSD